MIYFLCFYSGGVISYPNSLICELPPSKYIIIWAFFVDSRKLKKNMINDSVLNYKCTKWSNCCTMDSKAPWEHWQFLRPWSLWGPETFESLTTKREALGSPLWKLESND